jgi:hypothetical protein
MIDVKKKKVAFPILAILNDGVVLHIGIEE